MTLSGSPQTDRDAVAGLLGREPQGQFDVVVRGEDGGPVVIRNAPLLDDGTPMPTRFWLVGAAEHTAVSRLESAGGVDEAEAAVDPDELADAHRRYAAERESAIPTDWNGPRPSGGVGGTRRGVKCLHAHLAWFLAGGDDPVGRYVAGRLAGARVAAVDCGTNSTRLLVAAPWPFGTSADDPPAPVSAGLVTLRREMRITRLGEAVDAGGVLRPEAMRRCVEVLASYGEVNRALLVKAVRAVATSAVRDATNGEEFLDAADVALGVRPEVIGGDEEGRLSFAGATADLDPGSRPVLVVDIGGGSTELVTDGAGVSLPVGCVRITERFLLSDPPAPVEIAGARAHVASLVEAAAVRHSALRSAQAFVGLAGTVSALVMVDLGLDRYETALVHGHEMSLSTVESLLAQLAALPSAERRQRKGVEPGRADVIVGGAIVLAETMRCLGHERLVASERDILDGVAMALAAR
jgi:exopolyphosphatase / guanosine-5'-triphosphate,3'-diphosphate pyrophosphatase